MADGVDITAGTGTTILTDETASGHAQVVKLAYSADGTATLVPADANGLLVNLGANNDVTGPLTDAELRATAVPVSGTFFQATQPVSGPLTDAELRAVAVPISVATIPSHAVTNAGTFAVQVSSVAAGDNNIGNVDVVS